MGSQPRIPVSCTSKTQLQCYLWSVTASLGYLLLLKVKKRNILFCAKPAVWEKAYQLGLKVLCVWFCLISPTPARNVATHPNCKWFSTLILSLSLTRLIFPHLNARLKWIFTSVLFLSSLYFFFFFFLFLHHSHILIVVFVAHSDFMPVGIILIATSLCFERQVCGIWRP